MTKKNKIIPQYGIHHKPARRKFQAKPKYTRMPKNAPGGSGNVSDAGCLLFIMLFLNLIPIR